MPEFPQGTVTFAFTDIEGSTSLLKRLGDEYAAVLSSHRHLIREAFGSRGVEIDTQGDAFFYAFARARDAVAAAAQVQQAHARYAWPDGTSVRVRIGLHTGEPTISPEGYVGLDVVRAARLCGTCRGGQVLLSQVTRALVGPSLPDGVDVFPLGERELKDIDEPEVVFELGIEGVSVTPEPTVAMMPPLPTREASNPETFRDLQVPLDEWAAKTQAAIEQSVRESVEKSFDLRGGSTQTENRDEIEVGGEILAKGMAGFSKQLHGQIITLFEEIQAEERVGNDE